MQDDDFRQREAFLAVVRAGSFSAGARALGRDVSIISRRIAALEKRLGIRLIERTARRIRPTEEGRRYRQILNWQTNCCVKPKRKRVLWQHVQGDHSLNGARIFWSTLGRSGAAGLFKGLS